MQNLNTLRDGDRVDAVYLVRKKMDYVTKTGKPYHSLTLQDKTGTMDAKVWDPGSPSIELYEAGDFVRIRGDAQLYNNNMQIKVGGLSKVPQSQVNPDDFFPTTQEDPDEMYRTLLALIDSVRAPHMKRLLESFYKDEAFRERFVFHSAAKSVHHDCVGGLLEHTLHVTQSCDFFASQYSFLDRDLLLTAAMLHDIGKLEELSPYPANDYTDEGQLLGHISIGAHLVWSRIDSLGDFPLQKRDELIHCILAHHGQLEFGSPKLPSLAEAQALSFADNLDAKMETFRKEIQKKPKSDLSWLGFIKPLNTQIRRTSPAWKGKGEEASV